MDLGTAMPGEGTRVFLQHIKEKFETKHVENYLELLLNVQVPAPCYVLGYKC